MRSNAFNEETWPTIFFRVIVYIVWILLSRTPLNSMRLSRRTIFMPIFSRVWNFFKLVDMKAVCRPGTNAFGLVPSLRIIVSRTVCSVVVWWYHGNSPATYCEEISFAVRKKPTSMLQVNMKIRAIVWSASFALNLFSRLSFWVFPFRFTQFADCTKFNMFGSRADSNSTKFVF